MKSKSYFDKMFRLEIKDTMLSIIVVIQLLVIIVLVFISSSLMNSSRTIVIPKGLDKAVNIGKNEADENYLVAMANYTANLLYNFNSTTVEEQYNRLAELMSKPLRKEAVKMAEDYKQNNVSSRIIINSTKVTDKAIILSCKRTKYILDQEIESVPLELAIQYSIKYGAWRIDSLDVKESK